MEKKTNRKYQIADIQQDKLLKLGLDLKDAYILTYLKDLNQVKKIVRKKVDGEVYIWVNYEELMAYLPALRINTVDAMYRRFKKYEGIGLIKKYIYKTITGTYTFFHLKEALFNLFEDRQDI